MSLDYELSPIGKYRKGTSDDPYMPINQQQKIINQRMQLTEIPVFRDKVRIFGYSEVPQHYSADLTSNQYKVDYNDGIVYFHKDAEGKTLTATFLGRGNAYISSNRVWVDQNNGEVTRTLKDLIDTGETALDNIQKLNQVIGEAQTATKSANDATKVSTDTNTAIRNEEHLRINEENVRKENEKQRIESEQKRNQAELIRDKDETIRNSQEDERKLNEEERKNAEQIRETNESKRESEEEKRNKNEIVRQSQEDRRQTDTAHAISEANDARDYANQAANNAQNIADETRHLDEYSPTTTYKPNNIVSFDGSSYMNVEEAKGIDPSDNTKWKLVGKKGDSINWKRDYSSTTQYQKNDTVFFNGSSYIALKDNINISPTDKNVWDICAQKGLDGTGAGSVTEVKSVNDDIKVEFESTTPTLTLNSGNGTNQIVKRDANGKIEDVERHSAEYEVHGATEDNIPNRIIIRDSNGQAKVSPPTDNEHIARKAEVDNALKDAKEYFDNITLREEHQEITLKSGIQVIDTTDASPFRIGEIRGRTEIRDKVGIVNVTNPYAIAMSGNLLPPFTEWDLRKTDSIVSPYKLDKVATAQYDATISPRIRVIRGQTYTLTSTRNGRMVLGEYKEDGTVIGYPIAEDKDYNGFFSQSVTIGSGTDYVIVQLSNMATSGTFSFENTVLTPTAEPQPFAPQNRSMWAAECQLAANPVDGSNADVLHVGDSGLPYVHEWWGKVTLLERQKWTLVATYVGFKQVGELINVYPITGNQGFIVKYDGKLLPNFAGIPASPDMGTISQNSGQLHITISNKDSGWGDNYTPTDDEIRAYFLGWKMGWWNSTTQKLDPWDGTQPTHEKRWVNVLTGKSMQTSLPTTQAEGYTPYRLQYLKSKPTVEPVSNYETGLTLGKGWNMVEVGSGVVIREKANVGGQYNGGNQFLYIADTAQTEGLLKHAPQLIYEIYKNNAHDSSWEVYSGGNMQGTQKARVERSNYDPTAVYHVTYTMLDPTLSASISGSIATNLRGTVTDVVQWASDAERRLSVVETQKAEKDSPQWVKPTLLNGAVPYSSHFTPYYYKDNLGIVRFKGAIKSIATLTEIFKLPSTFRPDYVRNISCDSWNNNGTRGNCSFTVNPDGSCLLSGTPGDSGVSLDGIAFLAEQ